jgi:hypothetical protein
VILEHSLCQPGSVDVKAHLLGWLVPTCSVITPKPLNFIKLRHLISEYNGLIGHITKPKEDKMDLSSINWLAVIACVVISMVSGTIWYNPKTFFPVWWRGIGKKDEDTPGMSNMGMTWGLTVLSSIVQAVALSLLIGLAGKVYGGPSAGLGMVVGALLWAGLIAPTYLVNKLFAGHGLKIWAIEAGNHLLNFMLFGAVLGAWR